MTHIPFAPPHINDDDIASVVSVLRSGWITTGPVARDFERQLATYSGSGDVVCLNSCTAALELALRVLDIQAGDDVLVPVYTYSATAAVVRHVGARIVFVDNAPGEARPSIEQYLQALTTRTKAVITVDIAGVPYPSDALREALETSCIATSNDILDSLGRPAVIADAAHSLGASLGGVKCGALGDFTAYSFHAVKNLTTGEGGALTWRKDLPVNQAELRSHVQRLALHGQSKDALSKSKTGQWQYDIVEVGYKYNMPDILAAIGLSQLQRYDESLARRHQILDIYEALKPEQLELLPHTGPNNMQSSAHLAVTQLPESAIESRDRIMHRMGLAGISTNVHYIPLAFFTAYKNLGYVSRDYPNASNYSAREITLPLYPSLSDKQAEYVMAQYSSALHSLN